MTRTWLGGEDAAWLHMEAPTNPMIINGVAELGGRLTRDRVVALLSQHLDWRMRARIVESPMHIGTPRWEEDPSFDVADHVKTVELPSGDDATFRDFLGHEVSTRLAHDKPLWRITLIDRPGAGTTLLYRVHHALGDGFALLAWLLALADEAPSFPSRPPAVEAARHRLAEEAYALALLAVLPNDPPTTLKGELGTAKRVAWSAPLDLDRIKKIARAGSATVNDVLVAAIAGAMRRHFLGRGEAAFDVRAMVPVNLRRDAPTTLGNRFGLVVLTLPLCEADATVRLATVKRRMDRLKSTREAVAAYGLLSVMGYAPRKLEALGVDFFGKKASLVLTNVPGPRERLHIAGVPIERLTFWVPQSGHMGLGISIFSYAGEVTFGVIADTNIVAEPELLVADIQRELDALDVCMRSPGVAPKGDVHEAPHSAEHA